MRLARALPTSYTSSVLVSAGLLLGNAELLNSVFFAGTVANPFPAMRGLANFQSVGKAVRGLKEVH